VRAAVPDGAAELLSFLPSLGTAETMVFGESVNLPMRVVLNTLAEEYRPHSSSAKFTDLWNREMATPELMELVYNRWRARSLTVTDSIDTSGSRPLSTAQSVQKTRAALAARPSASAAQPTQTPLRRPAARMAAPLQAPAASATTSTGGGISDQMRQRIIANASGAPKAQSLSDVKSMLNSAFNRDM